MTISTLPPVPTAPPQAVSGVNKSSTEITVRWQNVVGKDRNGIIMGFRVYYKAVGEFAVDKNRKSCNSEWWRCRTEGSGKSREVHRLQHHSVGLYIKGRWTQQLGDNSTDRSRL